jgi:putative flippase GtrA
MNKKEVTRFLITGCSATAVDFIVYFTLKSILSPSFAKAISFLCGTAVTFLLSKYWTFEVKERSVKEVVRFVSLYSTTFLLNVTVNKVVLLIFPQWYFFAFLCSTGAGMVVNFIGQKWWVFKTIKINS